MAKVYIYIAAVSLLCVLAFCRKDGLWGALIKMFNVFFATMITLTFFQPLANMLDNMVSKISYYNDMLAFFIIFVLCLVIFTFASKFISKVNPPIPNMLNLIGSIVILLIMGIGLFAFPINIFMRTLPESPAASLECTYPKFLTMLDYVSGNSLKPMTAAPNHFSADRFANQQNFRNIAVYSELETSGKCNFDGSSGNTKDGNYAKLTEEIQKRIDKKTKKKK